MKKANILISIIMTLLVLFTNQAFSELEINTVEGQVITDPNSDNIIINKYDISDDYLVSSLFSTINTCSCSPKKNTVTIFNAGKIPNTYQIKTNLEYATLTENIIRLQPQESKEVIVFINTPCKEFTETLEVTVKSGTGDEKVLTQNLEANFCTSFAITSEGNASNYQPCELQIHEFTIFNTAEFKDTYYLEVDKFDEDITFSENPVVVSPYKNKTIYAYFQPDCSLYGNNEIILKAKSEKTPLESETSFYSSIERNYPFLITNPTTINQCDYSLDEYTIELYNTAFVDNTYEVKMIGPRWAKLSTEKVTVKSQNMTNIKLILEPHLNIEKEDYMVNITFISELGDYEINKNIKINVEDCYSFKIWPQADGKLLTCSDDKLIYFEIENTGSKVNQYDLSLDYDNEKEIAKTNKDFVTVMPGEKETIFINLNLSDEKSTEKIQIYANTFSDYYTEKVNQKIKVLPVEECYELDSNLKSRYALKRNQTNISFTLTNEGFKSANYDLSTNLNWVELNTSKIQLNPQETKELTLIVTPNEFVPDDTYKAVFNADFEGNNIESEEFNLKIRNLTLWEKIKIYFSPEPTADPINCTDSLDQFECDNRYESFGENEKLIINLSEYFYDPDGDELTFDVKKHTSDLKVTLDENIATVKSLNNWYGLGEIIFSASDAENTTYSDVFYVQAIDQPDNTVRIAIGKYWLILLLILLVIVFVLIILVLRSEDEKIHYEPAPVVVETTKARVNGNSKKPSKKTSIKKK